MNESKELALLLIKKLTEEFDHLSLLYYFEKEQHYFLIVSNYIQLTDLPNSVTDDITLRFNKKFPFVGLLITDDEYRIPQHLRSSIKISNGRIERFGE